MNKVFVTHSSNINDIITNSNDIFEIENQVNTEKGIRELANKISNTVGHNNFSILFFKEIEQEQNTSNSLVTENERLKKALNFAIERLDEYAEDDSCSVENGFGCYNKPYEIVNEWKKTINNILEGKQ